MLQRIVITCFLVCGLFASHAQTADDHFREPLKQVIGEMEKQYGVTISYTDDLVKDKFACTYRGKIEAKHKGMVNMYFVEPGH